MSRYSGPSSYGHRVRYESALGGYYVLSWTVDKYYPGDRLRYPHGHSRHTDRKGAERFAKRWKVEIRNDPEKAPAAAEPPPAKPCRHRAPQLPNTISGIVVFHTTKTGERRYPVKCSACGKLRELKKGTRARAVKFPEPPTSRLPPNVETPVARRMRHARIRKHPCPKCLARPGAVCVEWEDDPKLGPPRWRRVFEPHAERAQAAGAKPRT